MAWRVVIVPRSVTERSGWSTDWARAETDPLAKSTNAKQQLDKIRGILEPSV
jgi:hypothetical protein